MSENPANQPKDTAAEAPIAEITTVQQQLKVLGNFVVGEAHAEGETYTDNLDETTALEVHQTGSVRTAEGWDTSCVVKTVIKGQADGYYAYDAIDPRSGLHISLGWIDDGTYDVDVSQDGVQKYPYRNMTAEELELDVAAQEWIAMAYGILLGTVPASPAPAPQTPAMPAAGRAWERTKAPAAPVALVDFSELEPSPEHLDIATDVGYAEWQQHGQDIGLIDKRLQLFGVFDGLGQYGSFSAATARLGAETVHDQVSRLNGRTPAALETALVLALEAAQKEIVARAEVEKMGATTVVVAQLSTFDGQPHLSWASIGDSRIYVLHPDGQLQQLSEDEGIRHMVTNVLGADGHQGVKQHGTIKLAPGSDVLLVSDGITGDTRDQSLTAEDITSALTSSEIASVAAEALLQISRKLDDKTVIVARLPRP